MQLEIVVTHTPSWWVRIARWLGADIRWTHALLRYREGRSESRIIEAGTQGVIDQLWRPDRHYEYGVYRLQSWCFDDQAEREGLYERMYSFAAGEVGKRYRFEALPTILWRVVRRMPWFIKTVRSASLLGAGEVCTSLVDRTFLWGGFDLVPGETSPLVLPDEIVGSPLLEMIEHGGGRA
jgi:hypothetical protein